MKAQLIESGLNKKKHILIKKVNQFYLDIPFHFHNSCELVLIEESYGKRIIGDNINNFEKGDLVLLGPNLPHVWLNDTLFYRKIKGNEVKATVVYFSPIFLMGLAFDADLTQSIGNLINKAERGIKYIGVTQNIVANQLSEIHQEDGLKVISTFLNIIDMLAKSDEFEYLASKGYVNSYSQNDTKRFNDVYLHLINNFHREISLEEIASIAKMTKTAFCRYFKKITHKSFTTFINEIRIGHSCKLLQNEDYSIADVCYECGYNNTVNFNKFFKLITKQTPSEYRRKLIKPLNSG